MTMLSHCLLHKQVMNLTLNQHVNTFLSPLAFTLILPFVFYFKLDTLFQNAHGDCTSKFVLLIFTK